MPGRFDDDTGFVGYQDAASKSSAHDAGTQNSTLCLHVCHQFVNDRQRDFEVTTQAGVRFRN